MPSCSVKGCAARKTKNQPNLTVHRFPKNELLRRKWLDAIGPDNLNPRHKELFVCSLHFEESQFNRTLDVVRLRDDAVPDLFNVVTETPLSSQKIDLLVLDHDVQSGKAVLDTSKGFERRLGASVLACRSCLATEGKFRDIRDSGLEASLEAVAGVELSTKRGFPRYLCVFCIALLSKLAAFRRKCQQSAALLQAMRRRGPIKLQDIKAVNRSAHQLTTLSQSEVFRFSTDGVSVITPVHIKEESQEVTEYEVEYLESDYLENDEAEEVFQSNDIEYNVDASCEVIDEIDAEIRSENDDDVCDAKVENDANDAGEDTLVDIADTLNTVVKRAPGENKDDSQILKNNLVYIDLDVLKNRLRINRPDGFDDKCINDREVTDSLTEIITDDVDMNSEVDDDTDDWKKPECDISDVNEKTAKKVPTVFIDRVKRLKSQGKSMNASGIVNDVKRKRRLRQINPNTRTAFEKEFNCTIRDLSKEEQIQYVEDRKRENASRFACDECGKPFLAEATLRMHKTRHDPALPLACDVCRQRFGSRRLLAKHRGLHREVITCRDCGRVSRNREQAKGHALSHRGVTYPCDYCDKVFHHKTTYYGHVRILHPSRHEPCDQCGETFLAGRGIASHKALVHGSARSKCQICKTLFSSPEALKNHLESSVGVPHAAWPCAACGESCASEAARAKHERDKHTPSDEHYCKECGLSFASSAVFSRHLQRKHLGRPRPAVAPEAPRQYCKKPGRAGPKRGDTWLICELCGKRCSCRVVLQYHMNAHLGLKPFKCARCPKAFTSKEQHMQHMRIHTGERPYACEYCARTFALRGNFTRHVRNIHLKLQVKCHLCDKSMKQASLPMHVRSVHLGQPYPRRARTRDKKTSVVEA